jgi:membrane fusion protein (multidrug efflux system)
MTATTLKRHDVVPPMPGLIRRHARPLAAAILLGALGVAGVRYAADWWMVGRFIVGTDDAYVGGEVTVIAPKVAGLVAEVAVGDNQAVHAGDLLVRLDDRDYRAALAKAEGEVAARQASIANLDARSRLQEAIVAEAVAGIAAADPEIVRARDDQSRYRELAASAAASIQSFQKADASYKQAVAAGTKARATLDAARQQLEVIETEKQQAAAALAQAVADREIARLDLGYTELRAPIDGTIGNRSVRVGAYATVGVQLLSVVPARGLWVDANFKESQIALLQPGAPATVAADVLPGRIFHGHVGSLAPATGAQFSVIPPENATGNFTKIVQRVPVRILLDGEDSALGLLRPGLSVTVDVDQRPAELAAP